jgi:hypothetical protein
MAKGIEKILEKWILDVQLPTLLIEGFTAETPIAWRCRRP